MHIRQYDENRLFAVVIYMYIRGQGRIWTNEKCSHLPYKMWIVTHEWTALLGALGAKSDNRTRVPVITVIPCGYRQLRMDGYYSDSVITGNEGKKRKRKNRRKSSGFDSDSQSNKQYKPDARLSSSICDAISEANSVLYENSPVTENSLSSKSIRKWICISVSGTA